MRRLFVAGVAEAPKGGIDGVIRHGALARTKGWKEIASTPVERLKLTQYRYRLARERHDVRLPHLHPRSRDAPFRIRQVKLGPHCRAHDPPRQGSDPVGRFVAAARLDAPQGCKQLLGCYRCDRPAAKVRVESALQPRAQNGYGLRGERLALQLEPFLRHALEGLEKRRALRLALCAWIDVIRDEPPRLVALLACALQRDVRISAQ